MNIPDQPQHRVCDRCGCKPIVKGAYRMCPGGGDCIGRSERHPDSAQPVPVPQPEEPAK
jgi:hypothetical protein